jgi:CubicO group peptidase (beta-lactamase class C family)
MRRTSLSVFLLSFCIISVHLSGAPLEQDISNKIDACMERLTVNGFSGVLLVAKDGAIILSKGYGLADRETNIQVTDETVFTIGSITKQFTGAAILKLQMMGKIHVNDPIERDAFVELAMKTQLERKPGELYEYSNVGYSLLGAIIELVSGQSNENFLNEHLFEPAGMLKTGYLLPKWKENELAQGYRGKTLWGTLRPSLGRRRPGMASTGQRRYFIHCGRHVQEGENADSYYGYGWAIFQTPRNTRLIAHNGGNSIFAAGPFLCIGFYSRFLCGGIFSISNRGSPFIKPYCDLESVERI